MDFAVVSETFWETFYRNLMLQNFEITVGMSNLKLALGSGGGVGCQSTVQMPLYVYVYVYMIGYYPSGLFRTNGNRQ